MAAWAFSKVHVVISGVEECVSGSAVRVVDEFADIKDNAFGDRESGAFRVLDEFVELCSGELSEGELSGFDLTGKLSELGFREFIEFEAWGTEFRCASVSRVFYVIESSVTDSAGNWFFHGVMRLYGVEGRIEGPARLEASVNTW